MLTDKLLRDDKVAPLDCTLPNMEQGYGSTLSHFVELI